MTRIIIFALSLLLGAGAAGTLATAQQATAQQSLPACPERLVDAASILCSCTAEATASGSVWGSDLYTDDSRLCAAARHAGAIGAEGGAIWAFERPGLESSPAVTRNGVASSSWPAWRRSIAFRPAADASTASAQSGPEACPANVAGLAEGTALTCACTIEAMSRGSSWGDQTYTADSILCRAARHAGVIGAYGGTVRARVAPGQSSYSAATRNGITSSAWANYRVSLAFDR